MRNHMRSRFVSANGVRTRDAGSGGNGFGIVGPTPSPVA
jgi:hypothetical protein